MADRALMRHIAPGQRQISADQYNLLVDQVKLDQLSDNSAWDSTGVYKRRHPHRMSRLLPLIRLRNLTGDDLRRFGIVGIGTGNMGANSDQGTAPAPAYYDATKNPGAFDDYLGSPIFPAVVPKLQYHLNSFAVALQPIDAGNVGLGTVCGVVPVKCWFGDGDDDDSFDWLTRARIDDGYSEGMVADVVGCPILWSDTADNADSDGYRWAVVALGLGGLLSPWYNEGTETVNRFECFRVTGLDMEAPDEQALNGVKPDTTFARDYRINGSTSIDASKYGVYQRGEQVCVAYDVGISDYGEGLGPKPGQGTVTVDYPEICKNLGTIDSVNKIVSANWHMIDLVKVVLTSELGVGSTAGVQVRAGAPGSEIPVDGMTFTVYDCLLTAGSVASGKFGVVAWINGKAHLIGAGC